MPQNALLNSPEFDEKSIVQSSSFHPTMPDEEPVLAFCCYRNKLQLSEMIISGILGTVAFVCFAAAIANLIRQVPNAGLAAGLGVMGLMVLGLGLIVVCTRLFTPQQAIAVTESGIEVVENQSSRKLHWNEIDKVSMLEFYPHRFANVVLKVTIEPVNGRSIKFDTTYEGEPGLVIECLHHYCDYLVRNP